MIVCRETMIRGAYQRDCIMEAVTHRLVEMVRSATPGREIPDELGPLLAERVARAARAWPNVTLAEDQFVRAIAERLAADAPARSLDAMQTDDLYLACGCAASDPGALAGFEQRCAAAIARAIAAAGATLSERADLVQVVRQRLLVAPAAGGAPRIASYSARGPLPGWVRVVATRESARMLPRARRDVAAGDEIAGCHRAARCRGPGACLSCPLAAIAGVRCAAARPAAAARRRGPGGRA